MKTRRSYRPAPPRRSVEAMRIPSLARGLLLAVALVRKQTDTQYRVSMRSKGAVSVRDVAIAHGGGGHINAAACSVAGSRESVTAAIVTAIGNALSMD